MKHLIPVLFFICLWNLNASVVGTREQRLARALAGCLSDYQKLVSTNPVTTWEQVEKVSTALYGINAYLERGSVTELYAFIPLKDRSRFPKGNLILVQFKSMPWPDVWKKNDPRKPGTHLESTGYQDIRFLIYETNGEYITEYWYETEFQTMLKATGLTVPPPTPYYPPPPTPPGEKSVPVYQTVEPTISPQLVPIVTSVDSAVKPSLKPTASLPDKSANPLWWIISIIAALCAVGLFIWRKRSKN